MNKYRRCTALFIASVLGLAAILDLSGLRSGRMGETAQAEEGAAEEDSGVVSSEDLAEIFKADSFVGDINGQTIYMTDTIGGSGSRFFNSNYSEPYLWNSRLGSRNFVSLKADWSINSNYSLFVGSADGSIVGNYNINPIKADGNINTNKTISLRYQGQSEHDFGEITTGGTGIYVVAATQSPNEWLIKKSKNLPGEDLTKSKLLSMSYRADSKEFSLSIDGNNNKKVAYVNNYFADADKAYLTMGAGIWHSKKAGVSDSKIEATFLNMSYDHYTPEFTSTELIKSDGTPLTTDEIAALAKGGTVYVRCTVVNKNQDARDDEVIYSHVKVSDHEKYPTSSSIEFLDNTVKMGGVPESGTPVAGVKLSGEGIPVEITTTPTVFTYQINITADSGNAVNLGQMLVDDFFQSKRHSSAELVPEQKLIPKDDGTEGTAGKDYHYTRTPPNENGWNNGNVQISFYPGDYNRFDIVDSENNTVHKTLSPDEDQEVYSQETDLTGTSVYYRAKNTEDNLLSVKQEDCIKIDKGAPNLTVNAAARTLTLGDGLSGVWKLLKEDKDGTVEKNGKKYKEVMVNNLTDGNGPASAVYNNLTNGNYIVIDAAGNEKGPQTISVTNPPVIVPTDPGAELPEDEIENNPDGTMHRNASDRVTEIISDPPISEGLLTKDELMEWIKERYSITSQAASAELTEKLTMEQNGKDITTEGFCSDRPGACTIVYTAEDSEGNSTTLTVIYKFILKMEPPEVETKPENPEIPPVKLTPQVTEDEDGLLHAFIHDILEETITDPPAFGGNLDASKAAGLFKERYHVTSPIDPDENLTVSPVSIETAVNGLRMEAAVDGIDTSKPGTHVLKQITNDSYGNTTEIELTYILREANKSGEPDDGNKIDTPELPDTGMSFWQGGNTNLIKIADRKNERLKTASSGDRPKTMDTLFDPGCPIHGFMMMGIMFTIVYTALSAIHENEKRMRKRRNKRPVAELLVFGLCELAAAVCLVYRECALDIVLAAVWTVFIVTAMAGLDCFRKKVTQEEESYSVF